MSIKGPIDCISIFRIHFYMCIISGEVFHLGCAWISSLFTFEKKSINQLIFHKREKSKPTKGMQTQGEICQ